MQFAIDAYENAIEQVPLSFMLIILVEYKL